MTSPLFIPDRRLFLGTLGAAFFTTRGLFADTLVGTPPQTEGPFYPDKLPLDQDNDLIILNNSLTPAVGEITHLTGKVTDLSGNPLRNATVEIWQCDANAVYLHTADSGRKPTQQDRNFQGFGRFTTGSTGEYRFRTIKPVPYPGRPAPHIHVKVKQGDRELLTTQFLIRNHPSNEQDGVFKHLSDARDRELVLVDFKPLPEPTHRSWAATFDIIVGRLPDENAQRRPPRPPPRPK